MIYCQIKVICILGVSFLLVEKLLLFIHISKMIFYQFMEFDIFTDVMEISQRPRRPSSYISVPVPPDPFYRIKLFLAPSSSSSSSSSAYSDNNGSRFGSFFFFMTGRRNANQSSKGRALTHHQTLSRAPTFLRGTAELYTCQIR